MKIFVKTGVASESVNFVDENNRVLGWSAEQICCESHTCHICGTEPAITKETVVVTDTDDMDSEERQLHVEGKKVQRTYTTITESHVVMDLDWMAGTTIDLPAYRIDPDYFKRNARTAVFRLMNIHDEDVSLFVVLENYHNGYYAHGFSLSVGGVKKIGGLL